MTLLNVFFLLGPKFTKFFVEVSLMFSFECIVSKTGLSYFFCSDAHPKPKHDVMGPFFLGGGFAFFCFGFWFVWFVWFWFQLCFFCFGFGLGVPHASILSVFFQCFGLLFSCLWWVYLFKFCFLVLVWLDFLGFSGVCVCDNIYASNASSHFWRHQEVPPNATQKLPHKRQGDGNFASGRGVWEPKFQPMVAETRGKTGGRIRRGFFWGANLDSGCCWRGDSWGCLGMLFVRKNQSEWEFLWNNCNGMLSKLFSTEMFVGW